MMLEDDQTDFVDMILSKCRSLQKSGGEDDDDVNSGLDLVRAIYAVKTGKDDLSKRSK